MFSLDTIQLHLVQFCWLKPCFGYNICLSLLRLYQLYYIHFI